MGHLACFCTFGSRSTILVALDTDKRKELAFEPGDHLAIFPANKASLVQDLIDMLHEKPDPNRPIRIEVAREDPGKANKSRYFYLTIILSYLIFYLYFERAQLAP